ncbi:MAG: hypothetical protein K9K66_11200 [Desulfarculaceae bacterium]|nr:hypothetical protein [Desulfarculaceae bacterium]MCF8070776.1 hypothetical protein [Desulfarculaceae bacterium]MCF8102213.1 hypothetical protein [Desulfarculaceae bacterium]MCF8116988.1 hypothetical protein [Desulfarculaceae bacterium]
MRLIAIVLACGLLIPCLAAPAGADQTTDLLRGAMELYEQGKTRQALDQADEASQDIWRKTPMYIRKALFTKVKATAYGMYEPREDNVYQVKDAKILAYLEPVGYEIATESGGLYEFGFRADLTFLKPDGQVVGGKKDFMKVNFKSHTFNREVFLNVTVTVSGLEPGEYILALRIHDIADQQAVVSMPVVFK